MRALLILVALFFAGCAAQPSYLATKPATTGVQGFATLSTFGTFEMQTAPVATRIASLAYTATRNAQSGKLSRAGAVQASDLGKQAQAKLRAAVKADADKNAPDAQTKLNDARALVDQMAAIVEAK